MKELINTLPSRHLEKDTVKLVPSLAERTDLNLLSEAAQELVRAERTTPVTIGQDTSLRPKILDKCGMACAFCHNEGTPVASAYSNSIDLPLMSYGGDRVSVFEANNGVNFLPGSMEPDEDFSDTLLILGESLGLNELHLTGGEPTLHRSLPELIRLAKKSGYKVKMTSNGETGGRLMSAYAEAGLDKINFSIFGTTPEELAAVQGGKFNNLNLAEAKLNSLHRSITAALENGIKVDANIVMSNFSHAERVARIIDQYDERVSIRILGDLDAGIESTNAIYEFLALLNATPNEYQIEAGSSNARVRYTLPEGRHIYFKQIRKTTLPETCSTCPMNNTEDCSEGYYGVRLYIDNHRQYKVGVCLQRMDLTENITDFMSGDKIREIQTHKEQEKTQLMLQYSDRLKI